MVKRNNSPFQFVVLLTLVIVAALVTLVLINIKTDSDNESTFDKQPAIEGQPILGKSDAPVTIVEFGDFKCPACKAWGERVFPQLVNDYVETGKVKFAYINVLFHGEESKLGALAAEAIFQQNPESYWSFHKELFKAQPGEDHDSLWITEEKILEIARSIPDIDTQQLRQDLENKTIVEKVNLDSTIVEEFTVQRTPSIMVNDTMLEDPFDYEKIKSLIDKELEGK